MNKIIMFSIITYLLTIHTNSYSMFLRNSSHFRPYIKKCHLPFAALQLPEKNLFNSQTNWNTSIGLLQDLHQRNDILEQDLLKHAELTYTILRTLDKQRYVAIDYGYYGEPVDIKQHKDLEEQLNHNLKTLKKNSASLFAHIDNN